MRLYRQVARAPATPLSNLQPCTSEQLLRRHFSLHAILLLQCSPLFSFLSSGKTSTLANNSTSSRKGKEKAKASQPLPNDPASPKLLLDSGDRQESR
ncbi:hypothetical protein J5N97_028136 [Dioscorea zingiberensis]|uniref:Uncharacterized protein n=1 Tax=Dioscorea zingiberensis TaxID=325984 RepID=A0A9D5BYG9_9LILI|nr:hypothetical protein J5N97_028136 [Dioscorea zingiberensis]